VVDTYRDAADLNRWLEVRQGNTVVLRPDDADEVMITGDLHGHQENFGAILAIADLANHARRHLILQEVCHGGPSYESGGCQSHRMLEEVAALVTEYPGRVHFIMGNHELAELTEYPIMKHRQLLNLLFRCGMHAAYGNRYEDVHDAAMDFIRSSPLAVRLPGEIMVCHSAPERVDQEGFDGSFLEDELAEGDYLEGSPLFRMLWGRDYRAENADAFAEAVGAELFIHGHDPCPRGYSVPTRRQIILDCSSNPATYLIVPTDEKPDHAQLIERIEMLPPAD